MRKETLLNGTWELRDEILGYGVWAYGGVGRR